MKGCALEVDPEYPKELCGLHYYHPLAPNKMEIKEKMLPKYQVMIADLYNISIGNVHKFFNESKYVIHYENLRIYFRIGLKLIKIHCILEFDQSQWLKPYVNTKVNTK